MENQRTFTARECADNTVSKWFPYLTHNDHPRIMACIYVLSSEGLIRAIGEQEVNGFTRSLYVLTEVGKKERKQAGSVLDQILNEIAATIDVDKTHNEKLRLVV